jgi:hypothetical protein
MRIDLAVMSSDDNPFYLDFWPIVSKLWKVKMGVTPVLLYFGDGKPDTTYGEVIKMKLFEKVPLYLQCTCSRLWYPGTQPDKVTILSDIDMLPLSRWYFLTQVSEVPEDKYVHLNPCLETYGRVAICYNVARGDTYRDVLKIPTDWSDAAGYFASVKPMKLFTKERPLWFVDETVLTSKLLEYENKNRIVLLRRPGGQNGFRIDRPVWEWDDNMLKKNMYFDCHSQRPFSQYKKDIMRIAGEVR